MEDLKNAKRKDLEDKFVRMKLTYSEIEYILDIKNIATSTTG